MTGQPTEPRSGLPRSIVLDPAEPAAAAAALSPQGTVVLLLSAAGSREWAARAAVELSAAWAEGGRRVVLADLHLEDPLLHLGLDVSNLEGVVDIFQYGASLSRIARPVRDGAFYLIPAGTYAPDAGEIYRHPRWRKLVAGFRETDAALLLFAPAESADLAALAVWSSEAIVLGAPLADDVLESLAANGLHVLAVMEPPAAEQGVVPLIEPEPGPAASVDASGPAAEPELELPPPPVRRRGARRGTSALMWIFFAIVLLGAAAYLLATIRPDLVRQLFPASSTPTQSPAAMVQPPPPGVSRLGELLPYSVHVKAFTSLAAALEEMSAEQRRFGTIPFFISPEEIQGILYYKILAGLSADTAGVTRLRERLVRVGVIDEQDAVGSWSLLQFTPLAFDLGEFTTESEALLRADSLLAQQIPSYTIIVPYSDGSRRWQLYGGAFRDSASADRMRDLLEAAGLEPRLMARAGLPAPPPG